VHVAEWARTYLEITKPATHPDLEDISLISAGHAAAEDALAKQANRLLVLDTDHICTAVWSQVELGAVPPDVDQEIARRTYDLRLLLRDDVPFVPDFLRYGGTTRQLKFQHFVDELERRGLPYLVIEGDWPLRNAQAMAAVENLLSSPHRFRQIA